MFVVCVKTVCSVSLNKLNIFRVHVSFSYVVSMSFKYELSMSLKLSKSFFLSILSKLYKIICERPIRV